MRVFFPSLAIRAVQASENSRPPPRQWPWIAATEGNPRAARRAKEPWKRSRVLRTSSALSIWAIIFRLAPARKFSGFPEMKMIPRIPLAISSSCMTRSKPMKASSVQVFIASPTTSNVITPIPDSSTTMLNTLAISCLLIR